MTPSFRSVGRPHDGKGSWLERATMEHARAMAPIVRDRDRDELLAASDELPLEALERAVRECELSFVYVVDDDPIAMFGLFPLMADRCACWMITTNHIYQHSAQFIADSRPLMLEAMELFYPKMENWVDVRNLVSIEWLKKCGFKFDAEPVSFGVHGLPFYHFSMEKDHV